jgi:hypothetical protein
MRGYYSDAGVSWPGVVVRVGSPIVGTLAAPVALTVLRGRRRRPQRRRATNSAAIEAAVDAVITSTVEPWRHSPIREDIEPTITSTLRSTIAAAASSAACAALDSKFSRADDLQPGRRRSAWVTPAKVSLPEPKALGAAVDRPIYREVFGQTCWRVFRATDLAIDLAVGLAVTASIPVRWRRGPLERSYSWPIVTAFFRDEVALPLAGELWQRSREYQDALLTRWWWPTRDFVMVCADPSSCMSKPPRIRTGCTMRSARRFGGPTAGRCTSGMASECPPI